jgi:acetoin:2,6-dichlorophenolindophenol oxidoreductase subunit alpha
MTSTQSVKGELDRSGGGLHEPVDADLYASMALIRAFEAAAYRCYEQGEIPGTVHVAVGQEAVAVGVISALQSGDKVLSHHRGHGHALAKGVDPRALMAELFGKAAGVSGGKGGSMHATDVANGFLGTLAVVGSSVPLAVGVALASQLRAEGNVCIVFFGDGAVNQGVLYESMNLAALWKLPVLFVCEDNQFAITMSSAASTAGPGVVDRARAFGLLAESVDGQDVHGVLSATRAALEAVRGGHPGLLHCLTYRFKGHSRGDPAHGLYRTAAEVASWEARDPLRLLVDAAALNESLVAGLERDAESTVTSAVDFARQAPFPEESALSSDVWG